MFSGVGTPYTAVSVSLVDVHVHSPSPSIQLPYGTAFGTGIRLRTRSLSLYIQWVLSEHSASKTTIKGDVLMTIRLGETAPDFTAESTAGTLSFS